MRVMYERPHSRAHSGFESVVERETSGRECKPAWFPYGGDKTRWMEVSKEGGMKACIKYRLCRAEVKTVMC